MTSNKQLINPNLWISNYGDMLYNYAYSRLSSSVLAEDLLQDTFVSALKTKDNFRGDSSEKTWLFSILKRKIIDYYRKSSTKNEISESNFNNPFNKDGFFEGHWNKNQAPSSWGSHTDEYLRQSEFQAILEMCLSLLPEKHKSVFILKVMEDIETDKVCKDLGCTSSNIWVILHRAKLQLRECIEKNWINE
ncbi:MAG: sigma-70 family RNA polymerase sigma factor [Bacteroidales bacterium]|nr:sigma-70 family RNA polymerase sigma factor [Bacteroidales bacterium]